jgi:hypothetical protein
MYPLLLPVTEPFPQPKNCGNYFSDDFSNCADGAIPNEWVDGVAGHTVSGGKLITSDKVNIRLIKAKFPNQKDSIVQVDYKRLTTATRFACLVLRWDGVITGELPNNSYGLLLHQSDTSGMYINRYTNGVSTKIASNADYSTVNEGILTFIARGALLMGYLGDKLILSVTDTTYSEGATGLLSRACTYKWFRAGSL